MSEQMPVPGFIWVTPRTAKSKIKRTHSDRSGHEYHAGYSYPVLPPMMVAVSRISMVRVFAPEQPKGESDPDPARAEIVFCCGKDDDSVRVVESIEEIGRLIQMATMKEVESE